jgi:hypothetical protein
MHRGMSLFCIVAEFIPHDSRLLFRSLNHARRSAINSKRTFPMLPANRT